MLSQLVPKLRRTVKSKLMGLISTSGPKIGAFSKTEFCLLLHMVRINSESSFLAVSGTRAAISAFSPSMIIGRWKLIRQRVNTAPNSILWIRRRMWPCTLSRPLLILSCAMA